MVLAWDDAAGYLLPSSPNHRPLAAKLRNDVQLENKIEK